MDYQIRYRAIRDEKILCEVVALDAQRRPTGPVVATGKGNSKDDARAAAAAATTDPAVKTFLAG